MSLGVVIGTYAAVPYVHLQLESLKRLRPDARVLVADDCSGAGEKLAVLCREYGADLISNSVRLAHYRGDLSFYPHGLLWAAAKGLDTLVKFSRRWLWTKPWELPSGGLTYTNRCDHYGFGFRTEAIGFDVKSWMPVVHIIRNRVADPAKIELVEKFMHECSKLVGPLTVWDAIGTNRHKVPDGVLWHNSHNHPAYHQVSRDWGLPYNENDFWI